MKKIILALALVTALTGSAFAADDNLTFGGNLWGQMFFRNNGVSNFKGIEAYRSYFKFGYKFSDTWSSQVITEFTRVPGSSGGAFPGMYVKNAYIMNKGLLPNAQLKVGMAQNMYVDEVNGSLKTRWLSTNLTDGVYRATGPVNSFTFLKTDDLGFYLTGDLMDKMIGYGIAVHNGAESTNGLTGTDNNLAYSAKISLRPLQGDLKVGVHAQYTILEQNDSAAANGVGFGGAASQTLAAALTVENSFVNLAAEYANKTQDVTLVPDAPYTAYGATAHFHFGDALGLFARYHLGNTSWAKNAGATSILGFGPTYDFIKGKIQTAFLYETQANADATSGNANGTTATGFRLVFAANF